MSGDHFLDNLAYPNFLEDDATIYSKAIEPSFLPTPGSRSFDPNSLILGSVFGHGMRS